ncbi:FUSC family protein [Rathayibacter sp. YIM 133350]|uniref:FUSC family protein n=1 Tax=Rathayibacter sp. YIM 133350 TaxID=3131992 RepID=UPI00307D38D8
MATLPRLTPQLRASSRVPLLQVAKVAVATVAAWILAGLLLPTQLPVFAAIAALLVVQPSVNQSVGKAIERTAGVIAGVILALAIVFVFGASSWVVILGVVAAIFIGWALRLTASSASQIPISAMLVLSIGISTPGYALARIVETAIGAALGLIVNVLIVPPVHLGPATEAVSRLGTEIAATFDRLAAALRTPASAADLEEMLLTARLLRPLEADAKAALNTADESLAFNPRGGRNREGLAHQQALFTRMGPLVTRALGMTRALRDHYDADLAHEPTVVAIADELDRAAHDLRLLVRTAPAAASSPPSTATQSVPLLTAPLRIPTPHPQHWVLIGSLTEDLRRVHEEIVGAE